MSQTNVTLDPAALMKIKDLSLRARTVVEGMNRGLHKSPLHGFSVEFTEYRPYASGDDSRFLDWKLFARSDRFYIKRFEDETNLRCWFVLDHSRSMRYGSLSYTKLDYAKTLIATLGYFLLRQQDAVGLAVVDDQLRHFLPARYRSGQWHHLLVELERETPGNQTQLGIALESISHLLRRRGLLVLLSDLLTDPASLDRPLRWLKAWGHDVVILRILDPREITFALDEPTWIRDMESGRTLHVDPTQVADDYQAKFIAHRDTLRDMCRAYEVDWFEINTADPLDQALFAVLQTRQQQQSKQVRRGARDRRRG